jgi:hypothetical protein
MLHAVVCRLGNRQWLEHVEYPGTQGRSPTELIPGIHLCSFDFNQDLCNFGKTFSLSKFLIITLLLFAEPDDEVHRRHAEAIGDVELYPTDSEQVLKYRLVATGGSFMDGGPAFNISI